MLDRNRRPNHAMHATLRSGVIIVAALAVAGFASLESLFAPKAELWERWTKRDEASTATIDHDDWDALLRTYLRADADGINRFAYTSVTDTDKGRLDGYLKRLQGVAISGHAGAEQFAYWVNLYNALTVSVVVNHPPVDSIRDIDISPGLFADGPWAKKLITAEGEDLSLNDIEHRILRPIWRDPRIHYAVNCASIGCPNLAAKAYRSATLETMLDEAARDYINHPRGVRMTADGLMLSKIYVWFKDDFGGSDAALLDHLRAFASPELMATINAAGRIFGHEYDWRLNGIAAPS